MPIYDYKCNACEKTFSSSSSKARTAQEEAAEDAIPECPTCGKAEKVAREVAKDTSFQLKGGGWAKDRYGR